MLYGIWMRKTVLKKPHVVIMLQLKIFARLGELYLCHGNWKGEQIVSSEWVHNSIQPINMPDSAGQNVDFYGYQWWLYDHGGLKTYSMRGMDGQYVIVVPEKETCDRAFRQN